MSRNPILIRKTLKFKFEGFKKPTSKRLLKRTLFINKIRPRKF